MKELLLRCGLTVTESTVLAFLLEVGSARGSSVARRTGIKRPTVYSALASLERRGLVVTEKISGPVLFSAVQLDRITPTLTQNAKREFEQVSESAGFLERELKKIGRQPVLLSGGFEIKTIKGVEQVYAWLVENFSLYGYDSIFNPQVAFLGPMKEAAKDFLLKVGERQPKVREIAVKGPLSAWWRRQLKNPHHLLKEVELPAWIATDFNLCNGTVCMVNYERNAEMAVLIKHPQYFASMKALFEAFWAKL